MTQQMLQNAMIELSLCENNEAQRHNSIGSHTISLEHVYQHENNQIMHQWVALTSSESIGGDTEITGYMLVSFEVKEATE